MTQKIVNGFPQFTSFSYLYSKFHGTAGTQVNQTKTDIDLVTDTVGDQIPLTEENIRLLSLVRDGATLILDQGFELIAENKIRVVPGLLQGEVLEFKFFTGVDGVLETIPVAPPVEGDQGYPQTTTESTVYTDGSGVEVNCFPAFNFDGRTRVTTHFDLNEGRVDVYLNGSRIGEVSGIWSFIDVNTIELNDDYLSTKMKVDVVKQIVGA